MPPIGEGTEAKASTPGICESSACRRWMNSRWLTSRSLRGTRFTNAMPLLTCETPPKPTPMNTEVTSGWRRMVSSISVSRSSIPARLVPSGARKLTLKRPSSSSGMKSLPTLVKK